MENNQRRDSKLVFNYGVTRKLLAANCQIIDIKPDKENATTGKDRCVHVFRADDHFWTEFERINKEIAESKTADEAL